MGSRREILEGVSVSRSAFVAVSPSNSPDQGEDQFRFSGHLISMDDRSISSTSISTPSPGLSDNVSLPSWKLSGSVRKRL